MQVQNQSDLDQDYSAAKAAVVALARQDMATFAAFVLKAESNGAPFAMAPMHYDWCDLVEEHDRLVLLAPIESAKSSLITIGRALFELGRDPSKRIVILSNTATQAQTLTRAIGRYIEQSEELREVFPALRPGTPWAIDSGMLTVARDGTAKDPSVRAVGLHGALTSARVDLLIIDDVVDPENSFTEGGRQKTINWVRTVAFSRLTPKARVILVGQPYHPDDVVHFLERQPGYTARRYSITDDSGQSRWPEVWPLSRIEKARIELGPFDSARMLDVETRADDASAVFREDWIRRALDRGRGKALVPHLYSLPPGYRTVTGIDLGIGLTRRHDKTVLTTILVHPSGDREVLAITSGHFTGPDIVQRIVDTHQRYQSTVIVETVQAQAYIRDYVRSYSSSIPTLDFTTGRGEKSLQWQAMRLASELDAGRWILASDNGTPTGEVATLTKALMSYSPQSHTPDHLASLLLARWGAERATKRIQYGHIDFSQR